MFRPDYTQALFLLLPVMVSSQDLHSPELLSPKPKIEVNGVICSIGYEQFTCVPSVCDTVVINTGDSILFCTGLYTELNVPGYYVQWDFAGSNALMTTDSAITSTPICYLPEWNMPGSYDVRIYYLGSQSVCCCNFVPSQWIVHVLVLPLAGTGEEALLDQFTISQTQSGLELHADKPGNYLLSAFSVAGTKLFSEYFSSHLSVNTEHLSGSLILLVVQDLTNSHRSVVKCLIER